MKVLGYVNRFSRGVYRVQKELEENGNGKASFDFSLITAFRVVEPISTKNEDNIDYFIKKHSEFKLVDLNFDEITKILETDTPRKGCLQLIPKINSNDGFFIAVLQKL